MSRVGYSWAILKGRVSGDKEKAKEFLEGLSPGERTMRNRAESKSHRRRKKPYKLGERLR